MPIEIREVTSRRELKRFVCFAYRLYRNDPRWVPPLIRGEMETLSPEKNPAFEHSDTIFLMAYKEAFRRGGEMGQNS